jgi:hypothetical protein
VVNPLAPLSNSHLPVSPAPDLRKLPVQPDWIYNGCGTNTSRSNGELGAISVHATRSPVLAAFVTRFCDKLRSEQNMSTQEKVMGNWNQVKGKVKQKWGQLTDDELSEVEGNVDQLIGLV